MAKHAILPREHMNLTVGTMRVGESWYADSTALRYDDEGRAWLKQSARVYDGSVLANVVLRAGLFIGVIRADSGYVVMLLPGQKFDYLKVDSVFEGDFDYVEVVDVHVTNEAAFVPQDQVPA